MKRASIVGLVLSLVGGTAFAAPVNVALGASVTLNGTYGKLRSPGSGGWSELPVADASTLTDGIYRPAATDWNSGSVWWDSFASNSANNSIEVFLGTWRTIIGLAAQADDNDSYRIEYWDGAGWVKAWDIPAVGGYGLQARPNRLDPSQIYTLAAPVSTDRLRFTATGGDGYYGVSEIQAFAAVPEPGTLGLLGLALAGVAASRRRRQA